MNAPLNVAVFIHSLCQSGQRPVTEYGKSYMQVFVSEGSLGSSGSGASGNESMTGRESTWGGIGSVAAHGAFPQR